MGIPVLRVKVYFLQMKATVFYTLFLGIFLAGGVVGQEPRLVLPVGSLGSITLIDFSSDGSKILMASNDKSVEIWDRRTGKLLTNLEAHSNWVTGAVFSPDGKQVFTISKDFTGKLWDVGTGNVLKEINEGNYYENGYQFTSVQFSPDGKRVILGSEGGRVTLIDINSGEKFLRLKGHNDLVTSSRFSFDGKKIITTSNDSTAKIWDSQTGRLLFILKNETGKVSDARFSPDLKRIITICNNYQGVQKIWDAENGIHIADVKEKYNYGVTNICFSPDGKELLTSSAEIYDAFTGVYKRSVNSNIFSTYATYSPDGKRIAVISYGDSSLKIFEAQTGLLLNQMKGIPYKNGYINTVLTFSPDNKYIVSLSKNDCAFLWSVETGKTIFELKGVAKAADISVFSPDFRKKASSFGPNIVLWDVESSAVQLTLDTGTDTLNSLLFSSDCKKLLSVSQNNNIKIWNTSDAKLLSFFHTAETLQIVRFMNTPGRLIATTDSNMILVLDDVNGRVFNKFSSGNSKINAISVSWDSKRIFTNSEDGISTLWDVTSGKMILRFKTGEVKSSNFLPGDNKILLFGKGVSNKVSIWDIKSGIPLYDFGYARFIDFSSNWKKLALSSDLNYNYTATVWDLESGKIITPLKGNHLEYIAKTGFSYDGLFLATASWDNTIGIWDASTGIKINELRGHSAGVTNAGFLKEKPRLVSESWDLSTKLWDLTKSRPIYSRYEINNSDDIISIASGFYMASQAGTLFLHYVTKDLKVISFEQLDVKYNRPDKVLEAIGSTDTALIKSYRKAWEKRIKKLGIDTTQFREGYSVPECDFVNRDQIEAEQKTEMLRLHIKAIDSSYLLDRFNIWVNESPLFGQRGINIRRKNSNSLDTIITIKLSQGENRIECSITNVNGTESYRMPLYVNYTPTVKQKESLRFIGIGIDRFSENGHDLQYSVKDIRDLSAKLKEKYGNDIQIDTLFNENVNSSNVRALKKQLQQTTVNDKVILAYSGHGLLSNDYDYYLSTFTVNFSKPEQNGLPYEELENLLDSIPARRKLMLIDACHSGEVDKEEMTRISNASDSLQQQGTKGGKPTFTGKTTLGMKNSFELMQSLFVNVGKSTGATVISAAAGTQFALERGDLKNGVFTYSILEAMNKYPSIKISELRKIVGERVEKLTNGLQKPTSRNETISSDWEL